MPGSIDLATARSHQARQHTIDAAPCGFGGDIELIETRARADQGVISRLPRSCPS
jgi:hypothetical protein